MERFKKGLRRLLFPGTAAALLSIPAAAGLLFYTFAIAGEDSPVAWFAYPFSAWSLTVVCTTMVRLFRRVRAAVYQNRYTRRYLTDLPFKTLVSLYSSLALNTLYAGMKLALGFFYGSVWLITLGVYYLVLAVMRFLLLRHVRRNAVGEKLVSEWRRYRLCGVLLLVMTAALGGMVILVLRHNEGFHYAGYLIYAMAAYAFYTVITAAVNVVKYRRLGSPVLSAARAVNLTAALVSMLALETAMLSRFGSAGDAAYRRVMTGTTGGVVCLFVIGMAAYMMARAAKQLKTFNGSEP